MRLFVAVELPPALCAQLTEHGAELAARGGWRAVPPENLHITMAFLGERDAGAVAHVMAALAPAAGPLPELMLGTAIELPPRRPRVAAVEVDDPTGAFGILHAEVVKRLAKRKLIEPESRRFRPHVTVARRVGGRASALPARAWADPRFTPTSLTLFESRLGPAGAHYEPLARVSP